MAVDNKIVFGGVDSSTYNIYISGEGVFNAPKRDVEMITIPGRNGAFALDNGRFENITVTYPAFTYETSMATFKQNLANFRNALASKKGYQRLTDTFHTDEYRMAAFIDGIEIKPIKYNTASEFTITFDCKPQRWLTSGESAIEVTSGDTITNPTLFEAGPLLEVEGTGTIDLNGAIIERNDVPIGQTEVYPAKRTSASPATCHLNLSQLNTGDAIQISIVSNIIYTKNPTAQELIVNASITSVSNASSTVAGTRKSVTYTISCGTEFVKGTASSFTASVGIQVRVTGYAPESGTVTITISYDGGDTVSISAGLPTFNYVVLRGYYTGISPIIGDSTKSSVNKPTFIDLDIGEAYIIENNEIVSVNDAVELPATLPTLASGSNTITYDNTITSFKITPRWWRV